MLGVSVRNALVFGADEKNSRKLLLHRLLNERADHVLFDLHAKVRVCVRACVRTCCVRVHADVTVTVYACACVHGVHGMCLHAYARDCEYSVRTRVRAFFMYVHACLRACSPAPGAGLGLSGA